MRNLQSTIVNNSQLANPFCWVGYCMELEHSTKRSNSFLTSSRMAKGTFLHGSIFGGIVSSMLKVASPRSPS